MISIIIPVYNNYKELGKCLESLAKQVYKEFEIIVVDDGSDQKGELPKEVKFYEIEHGGAPKARNFGFEKSKGQFVLFCDSDMELREDCLEKMLEALNSNPDRAYAYADFKYGWKKFKVWEFDPEKLREHNYINPCSLLRRKDFVKWDESLKRFQDWDLWLTLLEQGKIGVHIPQVLSGSVTSSSSISHWLPKFLYNFPWLKRVKEYNRAKEVIMNKHNL